MKDCYFSSTDILHKLSIILHRLITAIRGNAWKLFLPFLSFNPLIMTLYAICINEWFQIKREIYQIWGSNIKKDWVSYIIFDNHILHKEIECSKRSIMDVKKGLINHAKHSETFKCENKTFYACANMYTLWSLSMT